MNVTDECIIIALQTVLGKKLNYDKKRVLLFWTHRPFTTRKITESILDISDNPRFFNDKYSLDHNINNA